MNVAIKPENIITGQTLEGKLSLVTGSTSGIGLGIARALGAAGSDIALNGFGNTDDIAKAQEKIAADFKVRVSYSSADMSKPQAIREMIENTLQLSSRLAQQPNKRFATVEELGALVVFLASAAAASITGATLPVDGGWTAH